MEPRDSNSALFWWVILLLSLNTGAVITIPADESEGIAMLKEGTLDTLVWETIRFYYVQPLNVPHGELSILMEMFPELSRSLPVSSKKLARYDPWDEEKVSEFFAQYPELVLFKPILQFNLSSGFHLGRVGFFYHDPINSSSSHYGQVSINASKIIKFHGRADFTGEFARWQRRTLKISPAGWCELQAGNFDLNFDRGLLYGYFSTSNSTDSLIGENWLYSNGRTWNGFSLKISDKGKISPVHSVKALFHERPSEKIAGFDAVFRIAEQFSFHTGVSSLRMFYLNTLTKYLHCGLKFNSGGWEMEVESGADPLRPQKIPLFIYNRFDKEGNRLELTVTFLPSGLFAPSSRAVHKLAPNPEVELTSNITSVDLKTRYIIWRQITISPIIEVYLFDKRAQHCISSLALDWSGGALGSRLSFSRYMKGAGLHSYLENVDGIFTVDFNRRIQLESSHKFSWSDERLTARYRITSKFLFWYRVSLEPHLSFIRTEEDFSAQGGIKHVLTIFENTFTELLIDVPFQSDLSREQVRFSARSWFLF